MDSKDLFNAINIAAEEYVSDLPDSTEGIRPVVLHADKKPRSLVKRIAVAAAVCAAVVAVGVGVTVGIKNDLARGIIVSGDAVAGSSEKNFAPAADILRIRDVGFYCEGMSDQTREDLEDCFKDPTPVDMFDHLLKDGLSFPEAPQVYFYNGMILDKRMLSTETDDWLFRYCLMSEKDRRDMTPPDEVKYLTEGGLARFENVGYLRGKYTEQMLEECEKSCASYRENNFFSSRIPPMPDVYYYNDVPYNTDQIWSEDAKNWLDWFCWLKDEDRAQLSGYAPEQMSADIVLKSVPFQLGVYRYPNDKTDKNKDERPQEIVTYKGEDIDVRDILPDTEKYIKWYNSLSEELQAKVWYEPQELNQNSGKEIMWNDREIIKIRYFGFYTDLYSEEEMAAIKAYFQPGDLLSQSEKPPMPDVYFFNDTVYERSELTAETIDWLQWYYYYRDYINNPMGYVPSELIAPTDPLVRTEIYYFKGMPIEGSELSDDAIRWLNWFNALSEEEKSYQYVSEAFYVPSDLSEYKGIRNPIPEGADPDAPLPSGLAGPDGVKLTYREAAYATAYDNNDAPADLTNLKPGMMLAFDFVYLAEPGSSEFKRYKSGDSINGMTVERATATFTIGDDGTASYYQGDVWFSGSLTVDAYMVSEDTFRTDCNEYRGAADGLPHIGFSRDEDSGEVAPFDYTINRWINSGENNAAAPGSITTDIDETLPLNTTIKLTLNNLHLMGTDSSQALFDAEASMSD